MQRRSRRTVEDILDAAVRVLRRDGALRFTTTRVAEVAGVSVGSLYQYFPNKHAIVSAVHLREVEAAWTRANRTLDRDELTGRERVRRITRLFFLAEARDVELLGVAPPDLAVFLDGQPGNEPLLTEIAERLTHFIAAQGCGVSAASGAAQMMAVIEGVGRSLSRMPMPDSERERWAFATADMVCDQLGFP
ncbi:MAG: TetR/AcrR family transcriptional regulator [Alphaproteobacteria bacterium]|nr:TetR/AcrR family transcriptional regulator [Alphaproteobacteria bacterium]